MKNLSEKQYRMARLGAIGLGLVIVGSYFVFSGADDGRSIPPPPKSTDQIYENLILEELGPPPRKNRTRLEIEYESLPGDAKQKIASLVHQEYCQLPAPPANEYDQLPGVPSYEIAILSDEQRARLAAAIHAAYCSPPAPAPTGEEAPAG